MTAPIIENNYTGDGSTVLFSFTFEYIETVDVEVSIDNVTVPTTSYSLANSTTVEFNTAPAVGAAIRIYRNTTVNDPKATFFPGSAIRAQDLNDNFEQILFVTQEADAIAERAEQLLTKHRSLQQLHRLLLPLRRPLQTRLSPR